jgi:hypothetical protein
MIRASDDGAILYQRRLRINVRQKKSLSIARKCCAKSEARIQRRLLSIKHKQKISDHFDQRLAEKEFGGKADEPESEDKEEQKKDYRADFRLHVGHFPRTGW